jgi:hypothetical protein
MLLELLIIGAALSAPISSYVLYLKAKKHLAPLSRRTFLLEEQLNHRTAEIKSHTTETIRSALNQHLKLQQGYYKAATCGSCRLKTANFIDQGDGTVLCQNCVNKRDRNHY